MLREDEGKGEAARGNNEFWGRISSEERERDGARFGNEQGFHLKGGEADGGQEATRKASKRRREKMDEIGVPEGRQVDEGTGE
jgi:hypothetical protein